MKTRIYLVIGVVFAAVMLFSSCTNEPAKKEAPKKEKTKQWYKTDRSMCVKYIEDAVIRLGTCTTERVFLYSICKIDDAIRSASTAKRYYWNSEVEEKFASALKNMYDARMVLVRADEEFRGISRLSPEDEYGEIDVDILVSLDNYYKDEALFPITPKEIMYMNDYYDQTTLLVNKAIEDLYAVRDMIK